MAKDLIEFERSLVGTILMQPRHMATAVAAGVQADWFTDDAVSLVWSALDGYWRRGEIEGVTPYAALAEARRLAAQDGERRSSERLNAASVELMTDAATVDFGPAMHFLRNDRIERFAKNAVARAFQDFTLAANAEDVVVSARNSLDGILGDYSSRKKISPRACFDAILADYREAHERRVVNRDLSWTPGLKMPWPKVTQMMDGLSAGLHVIAARPSVGKTSHAINLIRFWCEHGLNVLFCSLDMPRAAVMRRFIAERSRVSISKAGFSPTGHDIEAMQRAADAMTAWPLSVVETRDVDDLRTLCMIERAAGRLDVVVVDYLQLLHARALHREDAVEYARVSYVSDALKSLANELQLPVVALAQLNRESTKTDRAGTLPGLADLRGSGSIEQDAYTVTILHRDANVAALWQRGEGDGVALSRRLLTMPPTSPSYRYGLLDLDPVWWILCKSQNGPTGKLPFVVRKKYFCWMLGDYDADATERTEGYGSTQRRIVDYTLKFSRVHRDWRADPLEDRLRSNLALVESDLQISLDAEE